jgi:hypothetical protein
MNIESMLLEADEIHKEMHGAIEKIRQTQQGRKLSYEDLRTVFFLMKIAELRKEIEVLRNTMEVKFEDGTTWKP